MPQPPVRDRSTVHIVAFATVVLIAGFMFAWLYHRHAAQLRDQVVYSKPARVVAGARDYSVAASFAVKTSGVDAEWVKNHQRALEAVAKSVLISSDARLALKPDGLRALQEKMREASNAALHTDKVRQIVITDFLVGASSE